MSEIIDAGAIEKYKTPEPNLSTATEIAIPALFQDRFIVRFAYGVTDRPAELLAKTTLSDHPEFFLTYEAAEEWGKANCPVGLAYGITKLCARVSPAEIELYAKAAAQESSED